MTVCFRGWHVEDPSFGRPPRRREAGSKTPEPNSFHFFACARGASRVLENPRGGDPARGGGGGPPGFSTFPHVRTVPWERIRRFRGYARGRPSFRRIAMELRRSPVNFDGRRRPARTSHFSRGGAPPLAKMPRDRRGSSGVWGGSSPRCGRWFRFPSKGRSLPSLPKGERWRMRLGTPEGSGENAPRAACVRARDCLRERAGPGPLRTRRLCIGASAAFDRFRCVRPGPEGPGFFETVRLPSANSNLTP